MGELLAVTCDSCGEPDWRLRVADMIDAAETAMSLTNGLDKAEFLADRTLVGGA
jgi:uncharacterized protein with HEPN domain